MQKYIAKILKWTFIGLALRFCLMPFTMHGQDVSFINYFPMMFVEKGIWDPYGFISANFPHFPYTYYGPVSFIIMSMANFIFIKIFHAASLVKMLTLAGGMMFTGLTTIDYVHAFSGLGIFKNLFLMKSPYLIFDFLIAGILLKLARTEKSALTAYILWMLNIVVLHSAYAIGTLDLITAFFVIAALYAGVNKRPFLSVMLLSLGGATKLFPYALILPSCLLLGETWKRRISLLFTAGIVTLLLYLPFYLSSGNAVFGLFLIPQVVQYSGSARWILAGVFLVLYALICMRSSRDSAERPEGALLYYFLVIMLLTNTLFPTRLRYFVTLTPLLALVISQHKRFGAFMLFIIFMLFFSHATAREQQMGLFAPINPEYFLSLPTFQELTGRFIKMEIVYKILARVSPLAFFISAWWIWRIKSKKEKIGYEPERG